jgi:hypothetical protein
MRAFAGQSLHILNPLVGNTQVDPTEWDSRHNIQGSMVSQSYPSGLRCVCERAYVLVVGVAWCMPFSVRRSVCVWVFVCARM